MYFHEDTLKAQTVVNRFNNNRHVRDVIWNYKNIINITGKLTTSNKIGHYAFDRFTSS